MEQEAQAVVTPNPAVGKQHRVPKPEADEEVPILVDPERFVEAPHRPDQVRRQKEPVDGSTIIRERVRDQGTGAGHVVHELVRRAIAVKPDRGLGKAIGPAGQGGHLPGDLFRVQGIVGVKKLQVSPPRTSNAGVPRCRKSAVGTIDILNPRTITIRHLFSVIIRSVIHHNDFDGRIGLSEGTIYGLLQVLGLPIAGDDNGHQRDLG